MKPELIIFDFDGTLADTTGIILKTYRMTTDELGNPNRSDDEYRATIGLPLIEGFRKLYPDFTENRLTLCVETYRRIFSDNKKDFVPTLYPGVKDTLEKLAQLGIRMTIASSRSKDSLIEFCEAAKIADYFSLILGADDVTLAKPNPEPVLKTLTRMNVSADLTIVVGDMPVDIIMGNSAGSRTVGVTYGNSDRKQLEQAGADYIISSLANLIKLVSVK